MAETIKKLTIEGFKSIRKLEDFELRPLNVLIGANGAGKSNFVSFFRLLRELIEQRLQVALATVEGGADACLHLGPKITPQFSAKLHFGNNGYEFSLVPTPDNRLIFAGEFALLKGDLLPPSRTSLGSGLSEEASRVQSAAYPTMSLQLSQTGWSIISMTQACRRRYVDLARSTTTRAAGQC